MIWRRKYGSELISCGEVNRIIKARICAYSSLKSTRSSIDFPQQLNLEPAFVMLDSLRGRKWAAQFSYSHEAHAGYEVYQTLWDANQGTDLADWL
jgi:hypothetical protein